VLGDSVIPNVKTEHMSAQCFPGIRNEELKRIVENRELGNPETILIHNGTYNLRRNEKLVYVKGEVYNLVNTATPKFPKSKLILSGTLKHRDTL
jgi:hypothetical protein